MSLTKSRVGVLVSVRLPIPEPGGRCPLAQQSHVLSLSAYDHGQ